MNILYERLLVINFYKFNGFLSIDEPYKEAVEIRETHNEYKLDYGISIQLVTDMELV